MTTTKRTLDAMERLRSALDRIEQRATPHVEDTDEDRRRDLAHIKQIARIALSAAKASEE